jgi:hypothetical protein
MSDPLCGHCGKARDYHWSSWNWCDAHGGTQFYAALPPPDEPKRCTKGCWWLPGGQLVSDDCPEHGPNRPESAKEAGQELPQLVFFGEGLGRVQVLWKDFLAGIERLSLPQSLALTDVVLPGTVERARRAETERDAANQRADLAEHQLHRERKRGQFDYEQAEKAREERDAANERAEAVERAMRDATNANVMALHKNDALKAEIDRLHPVVEAARKVVRLFDNDHFAPGAELVALQDALRALDASPDAGPADDGWKEEEAGDWRACADRLRAERNEFRNKLAEAEKQLRDEVKAHSESDKRVVLLRAELAPLVERTARAQREACAAHSERHGYNGAAAGHAKIVRDTPLVSLEDLPQEAATPPSESLKPWDESMRRNCVPVEEPKRGWEAAEAKRVADGEPKAEGDEFDDKTCDWWLGREDAPQIADDMARAIKRRNARIRELEEENASMLWQLDVEPSYDAVCRRVEELETELAELRGREEK